MMKTCNTQNSSNNDTPLLLPNRIQPQSNNHDHDHHDTSCNNDDKCFFFLLGEIIGATNLSTPAKRSPSSSSLNPFVSVQVSHDPRLSTTVTAMNNSNDHDIHSNEEYSYFKKSLICKTEPVPSTCDPVYTIDHGCLFLIPLYYHYSTKHYDNNHHHHNSRYYHCTLNPPTNNNDSTDSVKTTNNSLNHHYYTSQKHPLEQIHFINQSICSSSSFFHAPSSSLLLQVRHHHSILSFDHLLGCASNISSSSKSSSPKNTIHSSSMQSSSSSNQDPMIGYATLPIHQIINHFKPRCKRLFLNNHHEEHFRIELPLTTSWTPSSSLNNNNTNTNNLITCNQNTKTITNTTGSLAIRFRPATSLDIEFMHRLHLMKLSRKNTLPAFFRPSLFIHQTILDSPNQSHTFDHDITTTCSSDDSILPSSYSSTPTSPTHTISTNNNNTSPPRNKTPTHRPESVTISEQNRLNLGRKLIQSQLQHAFQSSPKDKNGIRKKRTKPYPNPNPKHTSNTTFLSSTELKEYMYRPSTNWLEAQSTSSHTTPVLAKVYIEILSCHNLPNMDEFSAVVGNLTDSFISIVCEDSHFQTDVIHDELSPIWMPWTQRAFILNMTHALSPIYIGVLDYDLGSRHDGIGRIVLDMNRFRSDILYTLVYDLYPCSNLMKHDEKHSSLSNPSKSLTSSSSYGTIQIRLRKEILHERKLLLSSLTSVPQRYINMHSSETLSVVNFTCYGSHNDNEFNMHIVNSYINEIVEMLKLLSYKVKDAIHSLIMWKGQVKLVLSHTTIYLPLHSMSAFLVGLYLVEHPYQIPGIFFLFLAWLMIVSMVHRSQHPVPWYRTTSFFEYIWILCFGSQKSRDSGVSSFSRYLNNSEAIRHDCHFNNIDKNVGQEEMMVMKRAWKERIEKDVKREQIVSELNKKNRELWRGTDIHTKDSYVDLTDPLTIALNYLKPWMYPLQILLGSYCTLFRRVKSLIIWEESMRSFWVTFTFLLLGVLTLIIPSMKIIHFIFRLLVWLILSPGIRLYHEFSKILSSSVSKNRNVQEKRYEEDFGDDERIYEEAVLLFKDRLKCGRLKIEEAQKLKAIRTKRFGKYIAKVPRRNLSRNYDYPLGESYARDFSCIPNEYMYKCKSQQACYGKTSTTDDGENEGGYVVQKKIVASQRLDGTIIPYTKEDRISFKLGSTSEEAATLRNDSIDPDAKYILKDEEELKTLLALLSFTA